MIDFCVYIPRVVCEVQDRRLKNTKVNLLQPFVLKVDRVRKETNVEEVLVVSPAEPTWAKVAPIRFNKHEIACRQP